MRLRVKQRAGKKGKQEPDVKDQQCSRARHRRGEVVLSAATVGRSYVTCARLKPTRVRSVAEIGYRGIILSAFGHAEQ
jgi:hypothetical protein